MKKIICFDLMQGSAAWNDLRVQCQFIGVQWRFVRDVGLIMSLLSVWIRSDFERNVWQSCTVGIVHGKFLLLFVHLSERTGTGERSSAETDSANVFGIIFSDSPPSTRRPKQTMRCWLHDKRLHTGSQRAVIPFTA